jgi:hypothetical protein
LIVLWQERAKQAWEERDRGQPNQFVGRANPSPKQLAGPSPNPSFGKPAERTVDPSSSKPGTADPGNRKDRPEAQSRQGAEDRENQTENESALPAPGRRAHVPQNPAEEQADVLMHKVRRRERERLQWEKELYLQREVRPAKDW